MYRATTPTHIFKLPFQADNLAVVQITYAQKGERILQFTRTSEGVVNNLYIEHFITNSNEEFTDNSIEDHYKVTGEGNNEIQVVLTQEETASFDASKIQFQLRVKTSDGTVLASKIITETVNDCLDTDVI